MSTTWRVVDVMSMTMLNVGKSSLVATRRGGVPACKSLWGPRSAGSVPSPAFVKGVGRVG